ncbi:hypothetical protein BZM26_36805 [Paraburkholderia strydomiana]|nr:hypothetical protein BZM26_36805 [Paraburkholderia strydomiana]
MKDDHGMRRCWLKGQTGDAPQAVLSAAGYNPRGLLRAIVRLGLGPDLLSSRCCMGSPMSRCSRALAR